MLSPTLALQFILVPVLIFALCYAAGRAVRLHRLSISDDRLPLPEGPSFTAQINPGVTPPVG